MNILHISYDLSGSSAATRLAETQSDKHHLTFLMARVSNSPFVRNRQRQILLSTLLGIFNHVFEKVVKRISDIPQDEVFSFGFFSKLQRLLALRVIATENIDIVHVHWGGFGFFPVSAFLDLPVPVVLTAHDYQFFTGGCHVPMSCSQYELNCQSCPMTKIDILQRWVADNKKNNLFFLKRINPLVIAPSKYTNQKIQKSHPFLTTVTIANTLGVAYEKTLATYDLGTYLKYRLANNNIPTIITVGVNQSNRQNKGHDILDAVFKTLHENGLAFNYISIGQYKEYTGPVKRFHFDKVSSFELSKLYQQSDMCLVTSRYETFSQVTLESILNCTPVTVFDNSGPSDIVINNVTGFLVPAFDQLLFAQKVQENINFKLKNLDLILQSAKVTEDKYASHLISNSYNLAYIEAQKRFRAESMSKKGK